MGINLTNKLLMSVPFSRDSIFSGTVIYMCAHDESGAMGLVINRCIPALKLSEIKSQLGVSGNASFLNDVPILFGGPVEEEKGFVLHSCEYASDKTTKVAEGFSLTTHSQIIRDIQAGKGPENSLVMLGYSGWAPGQLENELKHNFWLHTDADPALVFNSDFKAKWSQALKTIGVDPNCFSLNVGAA